MLAPHLLLPGHTLVTAPKLLGRGGSRLSAAQSKPTRLPCCGSTPDAKLYLPCIRNSYLTLIRSLPEICIQQDHSLREEMRGRMVKLINGYKVELLREAERNCLSLGEKKIESGFNNSSRPCILDNKQDNGPNLYGQKKRKGVEFAFEMKKKERLNLKQNFSKKLL